MISDNNKLFLDMFIQETGQLTDDLTGFLLQCEKQCDLKQYLDDIFRVMHTIKGSSAMMGFEAISKLSHSLENLLDEIRKNHDYPLSETGKLTDLLLRSADFIKEETCKLESDREADGDAGGLLAECESILSGILHCEVKTEISNGECAFTGGQPENGQPVFHYSLLLKFLPDVEMANLRAYAAVIALKNNCIEGCYKPSDLEDQNSAQYVLDNGFYMSFKSADKYEDIRSVVEKILYLDRYELNIIEETVKTDKPVYKSGSVKVLKKTVSVDVKKLDALLDLVGELVISGVMLKNNIDLEGLKLDNFAKASRQHDKIINELQDVVMSIRMLPIDILFVKMNKMVRDLAKSTGKDVNLKIIGENTEVDKNIIELLSDPLMHLLRNAVDHGVEDPKQRINAGKPASGNIVLEAKNAGGDVYVIVKDDGIGLDKDKILKKAKDLGMLTKPEEEYADKEAYRFVLLPGFSTKESVSEISGRGVGMDVVRANIEKLGGSVSISSTYGQGTEITVKLPLTLAIINGMMVKVGDNRYIIPTDIIQESFRPSKTQIIQDTDGLEMIMIRGNCRSLIRLHQRFVVETKTQDLLQGILIAVEYDSTTVCLFADELLGERQVVVKPLPAYIKKVKGIAGCTIQGDGGISLILDVKGLI